MEEITYDDENFEWDKYDNSKFDSGKRNITYDIESMVEARKKEIKKSFRRFSPPTEGKVIYIDGGCRNANKGKKDMPIRMIGAWSTYDTETDEMRGSATENTTNNQMELMAAIQAVEYLNEINYPKDTWAIIRNDSDYVRLGILFWTKKWEKNNWMRVGSDGKIEEVKNVELWRRLHELVSDRKIYWEHVKAHSGEINNEKVDNNCTKLIQEFDEKNVET